MPERMGQWDLLDRPSDPIVADTGQIDERVAHYRQIADEMQATAVRLDRIGDGTALQGQYADKLRGTAKEVAADLHQVVGRYQAVAGALATYEPALEYALRESQGALDDAVAANAVGQAAAAIPEVTAAPGAQLTADQVAQNDDKAARTSQAAEALSAAKARLGSAVSGLETAGKDAAGVVGQAFHDGLKDSTKDKIVAGLIKFLKILVKVLTYLAMALAVIALLIPGLAPLILAIGIAMAAVTAVADLALAATHNGSWADFGIALAGLLTFGAGKLFGPAIEKLIAPLKNTIKTSITKAIGSARGILRAQPADVDVAVDDGVVLGSHVPGGNDVPIGDAASFGDSATVGYEVSFGDAASVGDAGSMGDDAWADVGDWADGGATAGDGLWGGDGASIGDDVSVGSMTPRVDDWPPQIGEGVLRRPVRDLDHANALYDYTYDGDGRVNPALRGTGQAWADAVGGGSAGAHVAELFTHMEEVVGMEEARAALPAFVGRTYRGVRSLPDALRLRLRPGDVFSDDGFFSTSRDLEPATEYAGEGGGGYLFTVDGVSGRDISAFSEFGLETEVLFGPSTRFSVIDVVHRPGGVTQVHLQER